MLMILLNQPPMDRSIRMEVYLKCITKTLDSTKKKSILALIKSSQIESSSGTNVNRVIFESNNDLILRIHVKLF
jgi:hypothetical protein